MIPSRSESSFLSLLLRRPAQSIWNGTLVVGLFVSTLLVGGPRGQSLSLPSRGVEEGGRTYIGEALSVVSGEVVALFVTGKDPVVGNGTMQDLVDWINDPLHSYVADGTGALAVYPHPSSAQRVLALNGLTGWSSTTTTWHRRSGTRCGTQS